MADLRISRVAAESLTPQAEAPSERVSRVVVETLTPQADAPSFRVSRVVVETLTSNATTVIPSFISSTAVLYSPSLSTDASVTAGTIPSGSALFPPSIEQEGDGFPRITQAGTEVALQVDAQSRVTQAGIEAVLVPNTEQLRVSQTGLEIVYRGGSTRCEDGGGIFAAPDPTSGETFVGRTLSPRAWATIVFDDGDRHFARDTYNHLPEYYGGVKSVDLVTVVGLACPFNTWADPELHHGEFHRFLPGCFVDALQGESNLYVDHNHRRVLAGTRDRTLQLWEEPEGLMFQAVVPSRVLTGVSGCCVEARWSRGQFPVTEGARFSVHRVTELHVSLMRELDPSFSTTWVRRVSCR